MLKRKIIIFSLSAFLANFTVKAVSERYSEKKASEASQIIKNFQNEMDAFGRSIDKNMVDQDLKTLGELDETEVRFKQIQFPLMKAIKPLENIDIKLTVQTGCYTASDIVPAIIDPITEDVLGFCIIKRKDTINGVTKETYATLGGFHEYGLTYAQNGAKEALEEAQINIPLATIKFVGLYDDPKRDARQHIASLAFTGATFDMPKVTAEAREVYVWTADQIRATSNEKWFGKDHRDIALNAIAVFEKNKDEIMTALNNAMSRDSVKSPSEPATQSIRASQLTPAQSVTAKKAIKNQQKPKKCKGRYCRNRSR